MNKILVTGATGKIGTTIIQTLLKKFPANQIVALVRDEIKAKDLKEKGVNICLGEYDDKASLDKSMQGVEKVLLISGSGAKNGLEQHFNVVNAAKKAGVKCFAYTGRSLNDKNTLSNQLMKRHFETEDYIKDSGLKYILFRNSLYMDTIPFFVGEKVLDTGIYLPAGDGKAAFALRSDMGEAIGNVLAGNDCENRIYDFTGNQTYSFYDVANALTELSGKKVGYTPVQPETYKEHTTKLGMPEFLIGMITDFATDIKNGQESKLSSDLEDALGRKPATLKEGLKILYSL